MQRAESQENDLTIFHVKKFLNDAKRMV